MKKLFLIVCCTVSVLAQAQVKLSFNPEKGERYQYISKTESTAKQQIMGQEIPMSTVMEMSFDMTVKEKTEDEIRLECIYNDILMSISSPMMEVKYDSKNPAENPTKMDKMMSQILGALAGKSIIVDFEPNGSVKSISGFDAIMKDMLDGLPENPEMQQMANASMQSFDDKAIKNMFEQAFKIYPEQAVNIGDSWQGGISMAMMGADNQINNTYQLKSIEEGNAVINVSSVFNLMPAGLEGALKGEQKGEIRIDIKTGMPISSTVTQTSKGSFEAQGMELQMEVVSKITFEQKK
ncbi:MAG: DUF6263 family protein [Dysgonamonadaceae bacterium]|jgi:molybdopterin-binding protein|nr:DUF6263 family protein [Dysgonamonadaceae bacterium]